MGTEGSNPSVSAECPARFGSDPLRCPGRRAFRFRRSARGSGRPINGENRSTGPDRRGYRPGMTSRISHTTVDCIDAYAQSEWWRQVLGFRDDPDDPNNPGDEECPIFSDDGATMLLFIEVGELDRSVKNRIHLDLRPTDGTRDEEVARLTALGATLVADRRDEHEPGTGWVTLADPEGNQFCVLRSDAER